MSRQRARLPVGNLSVDYTSINVGITTPVQLSASLGQDVNLVNIMSNAGGVKVMIGPSGSEVEVFRTSDECDKDYPCLLNKGMRVSILSLSGTLNAGKFSANLYQ